MVEVRSDADMAGFRKALKSCSLVLLLSCAATHLAPLSIILCERFALRILGTCVQLNNSCSGGKFCKPDPSLLLYAPVLNMFVLIPSA